MKKNEKRCINKGTMSMPLMCDGTIGGKAHSPYYVQLFVLCTYYG